MADQKIRAWHTDETMPNYLDLAREQYPILRGLDIGYVNTPSDNGRVLEYWNPEDEGEPNYPRPEELPLGHSGIQVFDNTRMRPIDALGDVVSHELVNTNPELKALYTEFQSQLDPQMMHDRYQHHREHFGEQRPYDQWYEATGLPEMFRGYTFDQWPDSKNMYRADQLETLNKIRKAVGIDKADGGSVKNVYGYELRKPYPSEDDYFKNNPHVGGMATEDNHIILNPYSSLKTAEKDAVAKNEAARLYMKENNLSPDFEVRPDQASVFHNSAYENDPVAMRQTILGRLVSRDPSIGEPTEDQAMWSSWLRRKLENRDIGKYADGGEVLDEKRFFTPRIDAVTEQPRTGDFLKPIFGGHNPIAETYDLIAPATETKSDRPMRYRVLDTLGAAVNLPVRMATLGEYNTADLVQGLTGRDFPAVRESEQRFYENNEPLMRPIQAMGEALPFGIKGVPHISEAKLRFTPLKDAAERLVTDESGSVPLRLSALHNLSPENLTFTEKQGGLSVPSVGIVKEGMGLEGFGNISLIGRKPLGDPTLNPIFNSDAYSIRQPRALYRPVKEKVAQHFIDDLKPLFSKYGDDRTNWSLWDDLVNSPDLEKALRTLQDSPALQAKFLQEKGINVEPVITDSLRGSRAPWVDTKTFKEFISKHKNWDEDRETLEKAASDAIDEYVSSKKTFPKPVSQEIRDDLRETLKAKIPGSYTIRTEASKIGKQEPDRYASLEKLKEPISKFGKEYDNWLHEKIAPMYGSPYLELGRKKVPYTLDNIVEAMTSGRSVKGQEKTMTYGAGKARAESARKFTNLEDMRNYADRDIKPQAEVDQLVKESNAALEQYRDALLPYSKYPNATWENLDNSMRAISDISKKMNYTPQGLRQALSKYDFKNVPDDVLEMGIDAARKLSFAPVSYFESKPQRAVGLNEFAGAVVPKSISEDITGILKRHNIPFENYENLNRESQSQATADFAKRLAEKDKDVLFSKGGTVTDLPRLRPLS